MFLVAVYGTLKEGCSNHELLDDAEFIGEDWLFDFTLYDLGPYPAIKRGNSDGVFVEVYRITKSQLYRLDQLEGYFYSRPEESLYIRVKTESSYGDSWIYLYNKDVDQKRIITSGYWKYKDINC
jgi:gamma-glutamylcyclotransferase (GGCT)/AIG2-like uncharacterized protein YtfP